MFLRLYTTQRHFQGGRVSVRSFITQGMAHTTEEPHRRVPLRQSGIRSNYSHLLVLHEQHCSTPLSTSSTTDGMGWDFCSAMTFCLLSFRVCFMCSHHKGLGNHTVCLWWAAEQAWGRVQLFALGKVIHKPYSPATQPAQHPHWHRFIWTAISWPELSTDIFG